MKKDKKRGIESFMKLSLLLLSACLSRVNTAASKIYFPFINYSNHYDINLFFDSIELNSLSKINHFLHLLYKLKRSVK